MAKKTVKEKEPEAPVRKQVDLDAELAKQKGTYAVGIQATIRELMKVKR